MMRTWLVFTIMIAVSACTSSSGDNPGSGGTGGQGGGGGGGGSRGAAISYPLLDCDPLVPEYCGYPFPSNVYTVEDPTTATGRRVAFSDSLVFGNDPTPWDDSDGFSAGTPILTQLPGVTGAEFGGPEDLDQSISDASPSILLDAETGELVPHFAEVDVRAETDEQRSTMIRPVVRLRDDARYIVAFRNLTDDEGALAEPSPAFAALRDNTPSDEESVEARRALYEDIFERLATAGWGRSEIQIAWDFNTASDENNTRWLTHMRDTALELVEDGIEYRITREDTEFPGDGGNDTALREHALVRIFGEFRVPLFMSAEGPGAPLVFGEDGLPSVNPDIPWAWVPFEVVIPKSAETTPAPIVEYGHGLFGEKEQIHTGGGHFASFQNTYNYVFFSTDLQGMSSADQGIVGAFLLGGDISQLEWMFDRLHQGFLNYILLMRMMKTTFAADENYGQYLDPERSYYYGISQGGIMGSVFMAMSPDVERGALGVMGQPYSLLLFRSKDFTQFLDIIKESYEDVRDHQLMVGLFQMLWDRVEPNGYTHRIGEEKTVLMRAALGDHQVPTLGAHIMARTLGAKHLDSGLRDVWRLDKVPSTSGESFYTEYDFDLPGDPLCNVPMLLCRDPHEWPRRRTSARIQLDDFLQNGVGENYCGTEADDDIEPATGEKVCSYPSLSGCTGETDEDAQALCMPQ